MHKVGYLLEIFVKINCEIEQCASFANYTPCKKKTFMVSDPSLLYILGICLLMQSKRVDGPLYITIGLH